MKRKPALVMVAVFAVSVFFVMQVFAQKVETAEGVRVVHNEKPVWGKEPKVALKLIQTIGGLDAVKDEYMLYLPADIVEDEQGNIYVLDAGNYRIQKYDANGAFLLSFGRQGMGPGVFSSPQSIAFGNDGNIYIFDMMNGLVQVFGQNGKPVNSFRPEESMTGLHSLRSGEFTVTSLGSMMRFGTGGGRMNITELQKQKAEDMPLIRVVDSEGVLKREFGKAEEYGDGFTNREGNRYDMTTDSGDNIYVSFRFQNRIEKYSPGGNLLMKIDRPLDYKVTKAKGELKVDDEGAGRMNIMLRSPELNEVSLAVGVDGNSRIWVVTNRRQLKDDEKVSLSVMVSNDGVSARMSQRTSGNTDITETDAYELEVFSPDGILLGKVPLTHFVDAMRIYGDRLYIVDKLRGMRVFEYRIVEK